MQRSGRVACAALMVITVSFAGCLSSGNQTSSGDSIPDWDKDMVYVDDPMGHEDARMFDVGSPFSNQSWGNSSWAVFGNEEGGNCCEHYLAATKEGWILNFGGESVSYTHLTLPTILRV